MFGKYWYSDPMEIRACSAMRLVVAGGVSVLGENVSSGGEDALAGELGADLTGLATWLETAVGRRHRQDSSVLGMRVVKELNYCSQ